MLGWFRSSEEVGWYSAPQRIIQLIYLVPGIISISILPVFSRLALQSKERVASAIEHSLTVAYLAALPIAVGGIIVAPSLIKLLFGSPFLPGATPMQILFLTLLADFPAVLLGNVLLAYNQQKNLVTYSAIGGFMNVTLNLLLIPRFGIVGCAIATLGAQIASNAYLQRVVRRTNPFRVLPKITNAILATMIMGVCVFLLQSAGVHVIASIVLGALAYGGVLYLRGEPLLFEFRKVISGPLPVRETK
jgi:O-antigen/teichoic acid export membrane protein